MDRKNRNPKPPPPTDGGREETMRRIVEAFPALGGRMVSPAELARRTAGLNGSTAAWIAALLGACLDSAVVAPLSVVDRRLAAKKYSRQDEAAIRRMLSPPLPPRAHYSGRCPQCRYDTGADLSPGRGTIEAQCGNCGAAVPLREEGGVPG